MAVEKKIIDDNILIIKLPARLGIGFKDEEFNEIKQLITETDKKIILNLENTKAIDSSSIGIILKKYVDYKNINRERDIVICCVKNIVKRSLDIIPIDKYISVFETEEEAINYFK